MYVGFWLVMLLLVGSLFISVTILGGTTLVVVLVGLITLLAALVVFLVVVPEKGSKLLQCLKKIRLADLVMNVVFPALCFLAYNKLGVVRVGGGGILVIATALYVVVFWVLGWVVREKLETAFEEAFPDMWAVAIMATEAILQAVIIATAGSILPQTMFAVGPFVMLFAACILSSVIDVSICVTYCFLDAIRTLQNLG